MKKEKTKNNKVAELRKRAEEKLRFRATPIEKMSDADILKLTHELQIHQIELEMQNEDLRKSQNELAESRDRYSWLYDFAPVGYLTISEKGLIIEANLTFALMLDMERGLLIKKQLSKFIAREDQDIFYHHHRQILNTKELEICELKMLTKDGAKFHAHLESEIVLDQNDHQCKIIVSDITKRKHADELVSKLSRAIEYNPCTIIITDNEAKIEYVNPKFTQLTGYTAQEVLGKNPSILNSSMTPSDEFVNLWRTIDAGSEWRGEFCNKKKNGELYWESATISSIKNAKGKITHYVAVKENITERKKTENELLKVQKLESLGVLAGSIAHDLNNYLTAIMGNITLAKMDVNKEDKVYSNLEDAERVILRTEDLTNQLITFSKGGLPIKKVVSVNKIIDVSMCLSLRGTDIICQYFISEDIWPVEVDEGQIVQVINNIVINAKHAMPEGGNVKLLAKNITIGDQDIPSLKSGDYVKITIEDQGEGIPKEVMQKIFDPFFSTKEKGSGLGLASCYSIIRNHGGYISVESEVGAGTTFHIYLPAIKDEIPTKDDETEYPSVGKGKILFMDDEDALRDVTGKLLKNIGYEVKLAREGSEAINLYKEAKGSGNPFDAVILDLTVRSGMGGKETIKKLIEFDPGVKAIVLSGYSEGPILSSFGEYGFKNIVKKPYQILKLNKILCDVIMGTDD